MLSLLRKTKQLTKFQNFKYSTINKSKEELSKIKTDEFEKEFSHVSSFPDSYKRKVRILRETRDPSQMQQFDEPKWTLAFERIFETNWADPLMGKFLIFLKIF